MQPLKRNELNEVFLLRGLASMMVCLFHLVLGNAALFPSDNWLEQIFSYGYLGVEFFFILSGYVICYSLPEDFGFRHMKTFFLKRIARIEPPYIASIVLVVGLNFLSHKVTGLPNQIDFFAIISHLAYINNFNPTTYVNVVYWTLGIEAQFYLLIALIFPAINVSKNILLPILATFIAIACIQLPGSISVILPFLAYFTLGILLFFYKVKQSLSLPVFVTFCSLALVQLFVFQGIAGMLAALITVSVILFWNYVNRPIKFFSMISYSLYLVHVPIGGKVINLGMRFAKSDGSKYALVLIALLISIGFAFIFYKLVELPAFRLSKQFKYKPSAGNIFIASAIANEAMVSDKPISVATNKTQSLHP